MTKGTIDRLTPLVEAAIAAFPGLAYSDGTTRADAAADLVEAGQIRRAPPVDGIDYWIVGTHYVSIKGGECDCPDNRAPSDGRGKLCKHRLAAMFFAKLDQGTPEQHIQSILNSSPGDDLTLRIVVWYVGARREYDLAGYHYPGQPWVYYGPKDLQRFTERQFETALKAAGWQICGRPSKQPGYVYHYPLARASEDLPYWTISAHAHEVVRRWEEEDAFREIEELEEIEREANNES